jgi:hypothetical protein
MFASFVVSLEYFDGNKNKTENKRLFGPFKLQMTLA